MNLPNKLTLTRIILVPVFMVFVSLTQIGTEISTLPGIWWQASSLPRPALLIFWTAIWPASGTWSPTLASLPTRWPTNC